MRALLVLCNVVRLLAVVVQTSLDRGSVLMYSPCKSDGLLHLPVVSYVHDLELYKQERLIYLDNVVKFAHE